VQAASFFGGIPKTACNIASVNTASPNAVPTGVFVGLVFGVVVLLFLADAIHAHSLAHQVCM
jgi:hypothetical protein